MSCILRPVARASGSTLPLARIATAAPPRRRIHSSHRLASEPSPSPSSSRQPGQITLPAEINPANPWAAARLATANIIRPPSTIDKTSYQQLSTELLLLRGNEKFFRLLHSPLLWDVINTVETKEQFRETMELIKVWRQEGARVDWRIGQKIVELSLSLSSPHLALFALMHPISFGLHLFSPSHPPLFTPTQDDLLTPTSTPKSSAERDFFLKYTVMADSDTRDRKNHLPNLPRTNPYIELPTPRVLPVQNPRDLQPITEGVTEPVVLKELMKVLLSGEGGEELEKTPTFEEARFLHELGERFFPRNATLNARYLSFLRSRTDDEKKGEKRFMWAQNALGEVDSLVFEKSEGEEEAVRALVEGEGWPLYVRTKELMEGRRVEVEGKETDFDRSLGQGMGGLVGGEAEAEAEAI